MAIAFDAVSGTSSGVGTSRTLSHTCSGTNRILFVLVVTAGSTADRVSGVTYAGQAMTEINATTCNEPHRAYLYYIIAPATGANDIVVSATESTGIDVTGVSYTGVKQTGQPDAHNTASPAAGTSTSVTVTTVADNCWVVGGGRNTATTNQTAGANTTQRTTLNLYCALYDTNGAVTPAGDRTLAYSWTNNNTSTFVAASFSPVPDVTFVPKIIIT